MTLSQPAILTAVVQSTLEQRLGRDRHPRICVYASPAKGDSSKRASKSAGLS